MKTDENQAGCIAVILAAGYSSRMKSFKPLLNVGGTPALQRLITAARNAGVNDVVVVTGYMREKLRPIIREYGAVEAYNESFDKGMFSSIKAGLSAAADMRSEKWRGGIFLMPVDCPLIDCGVIARIKTLFEESCMKETAKAETPVFIVPTFEGKKGHPLFIPSAYINEICGYDGDGGLKAITDKYADRMKRTPVENEGVVMDMDTPEGYEEIRLFAENNCRRRPLTELAADRRIILARHGATMQHAEKMFIGQYDVPLSEAGVKQMRNTASLLAELLCDGSSISRIYTSDLVRAAESAQIIAGIIGKKQEGGKPNSEAEVIELKALREINLGEWDGKPIREIRESYPFEYEQRGKDIFTFKTGNKAENFYDLQYRAVKCLRKILENDDSKDIVIVAHSGVIRALENNLKGLRVDDGWQSVNKGELRVIKGNTAV